jgi:putative transposase
LIAPLDDQLSITHQCELLGVARSSLYYSPVPVDSLTLALMKAIDREYTAHPFFGARKILLAMRDLIDDIYSSLLTTIKIPYT